MIIPLIKIFNSDLVLQGAVTDYDNLNFVRSWNSAGSFSFTLNVNSPNSSICLVNNIVYLDANHIGWITAIEIDRDIGGKAAETMTVSGIELKDILTYRITENWDGNSYTSFEYTSDAPETIIKNLIDKNIGQSAPAGRIISVIDTAADGAKGTLVDFSTRHKNLLDEVFALLQVDAVGLIATLDLDTPSIIFDVVEGVDRTAAQSTNDRVILSLDTGTLNSLKYKNNQSSYRNYAFVGGQGEGNDRTIIFSGDTDKTGFDRREVFVDARDIATEDELTVRGDQKIAGYSKDESINCVVRNMGTYEYLTDYDLGDFVTIIDTKIGISQTAQITAIKQTYAGTAIPKLEVVLGDDTVSAAQVLKSRISESTSAIVAGSSSSKPTLTGTSAPTTSTAGSIGQLYVDTVASIVYICKTVSGVIYTWDKVTLGAAPEEGSNANGYYIKFDSGTLICTGTVDVQLANSLGSQAKSFPASFIDTNISVSVNAELINNTASLETRRIVAGARAYSTSAFYTYVSSYLTGIDYLVNFRYIAIGRWK